MSLERKKTRDLLLEFINAYDLSNDRVHVEACFNEFYDNYMAAEKSQRGKKDVKNAIEDMVSRVDKEEGNIAAGDANEVANLEVIEEDGDSCNNVFDSNNVQMGELNSKLAFEATPESDESLQKACSDRSTVSSCSYQSNLDEENFLDGFSTKTNLLESDTQSESSITSSFSNNTEEKANAENEDSDMPLIVEQSCTESRKRHHESSNEVCEIKRPRYGDLLSSSLTPDSRIFGFSASAISRPFGSFFSSLASSPLFASNNTSSTTSETSETLAVSNEVSCQNENNNSLDGQSISTKDYSNIVVAATNEVSMNLCKHSDIKDVTNNVQKEETNNDDAIQNATPNQFPSLFGRSKPVRERSPISMPEKLTHLHQIIYKDWLKNSK